LPHSYAYQESKGVLEAVIQAQTYINQGNSIVAEVDIHSFFDEIPLEKLILIMSDIISDEKVFNLIKSYLYCRIYDGSQTIFMYSQIAMMWQIIFLMI
jgi:retron-type reverse transcriptase